MPSRTQLRTADIADIREAYANGVGKQYLRRHYRISDPRLREIVGGRPARLARPGGQGVKRQRMAEMLRLGYLDSHIRDELGAHYTTIARMRVDLGLQGYPIMPSTDTEAAPVADENVQTEQPTVMHHREITPSYLEKVRELEKRGFTPSPEDITSEDEQPAPAQAYTPQEYFEAIADGLRQRDAENAGLRAQIDRMEVETRRLRDDLVQCKMQMANWSGPAALPNRSLGNGG